MRVFFHAAMILCLLPALVLAGSSTTSGSSNTMNPAVSVNGLCLADHNTEYGDADHNGFRLQEAEMHFTSMVDPFWKANVILAVFPEDNGGEYGINVEEANIASTSLPSGLALKLGKAFLPFGKHARLHTHQFAFVEAPAAVNTFLGEGLTEVGAEAAWGLPLPWFSDLVAYGVAGDTETFDRTDGRIVVGGHWMNLWDVSDNATFELGCSAISGPASMEHFGRDGDVTTYGLDASYKWVSSTSSHGPALTLMAEYIVPTFESDAGDPAGWYALAQTRVHHNWWFGLGAGGVDCGDGAGVLAADSPFNGELKEYKANITRVFSEFSALRLEAAWYDDRVGDTDNLQISLQWNFTIGSHPAHLY